MYLMALGNIDYIVITILFAIIFVIAYLFRHQNRTAGLFIYGGNDEMSFKPTRSLIGCGVIELVLCGVIGAIYGVSGIYYITLAILLGYFLSLYVARVIYPNSLFDYIGNVIGPKTQAIFAAFSILVLLFLAITTTVFTFKLFQPILGWNFVNSVFGITGLTLIYILTGGSKAVKYNTLVSAAIVFLVFLLIVVLGGLSLGGLSGVLANLHDLAVKKGSAYNYYTGFNINASILCQIVLAGLFLTMASFLGETKQPYKKNMNDSNHIIKIMPLWLIVMSGIIAIATPINKNNVGDNQVVTIQAQLPDGQTGYVVKTISNSKTTRSEITTGIIPPLLNPNTNLIEPGNYNYMLASAVALKHYLPKYLSVMLVLVILSSFMFALALYLLGISKLVVFDVYTKLGWLYTYGEAGSIWLTRMTIIVAGGISLFGGYFATPYLGLTELLYIAGGFAVVFCLFVLFIVTYYGRQTQKK